MIPKNITSLILDMDGVLWKDAHPIGDLPRIFARLRQRGLRVAFATNNGSLTPEQYVARLAGFGVRAEAWQVVTSALAAAELAEMALTPSPLSHCGGEEPRARVVFAVGGAGVMEALRARGLEPLPVERADEARAVVMGFDRQITFEKMCAAALLVRRGVPFFATNPDKTFPTPRGEVPGTGAWASVIVTATGIEPVFAGKPAPHMIELARARLGAAKEETLVVGDRLETDASGGQAAGCPVALVLSGVSTRAQAEAWRPRVDVIARDLEELAG
jgi:4-nitrophenyl phosphatase